MILIFFLILATLLRLTGLAAPALWYDEWLSHYRASLPLLDYFRDTYEYTGANLWEIILRPFVAGPDWLVRVPSLVCAIASLWIAWKIMQTLELTPTQRTIAGLALASLPGLLWMAQDARYYAAIGLLYMLAVWAALTRRYAWIFISAGLSLYIHPIAPAYTVFAPLVLMIFQRPEWKKLIIGGALTALAWLPRLYQVLFLARSYGEFWSKPLTMDMFAYEYGQSLTVNTIGEWRYVVVLLIGLIFFGGLWRAFGSKTDRALVLISLAPLVILVSISLVSKNVITYRTLQPAALGLCLLCGRVLPFDLRRWWESYPTFFAAMLLLGMLVNYDPSVRDGDLKAMTDHIRYAWQAGDTLVYVTGTAAPFDTYLSDLKHCQLDWPNSDINLEPPEMRQTPRCQLDQLPGRVWLVWPHSPLLSPALVKYLESITQGQTSIALSIQAWQMAPLEIYLLKGK